MTKSRFTETKIRDLLREAREGGNVQEICSKYGISDAMFESWCARYGDPEYQRERRLKQLEDENQRLRAIVADLTLRNQALKRVVSKKW